MKTEAQNNTVGVNMARRSFLRYAGAGVAGIGILTAATSCHKDHNVNPITGSVDVGSGDIGILNYAYALEQLEAAFYIQVVKTPYASIPSAELTALTAIRDHEVCHREFFKAALGAKAIPGLTVDFSAIDFTSRTSVLAAAKAFEDLGVTAYDGIAYKIVTVAYLGFAGAIVSVEARHAAYISDLITPGSFAASDQVSASTGLNISNTPTTVLAGANTYLKTKVTFNSFTA
jgi:hypothetical protein